MEVVDPLRTWGLALNTSALYPVLSRRWSGTLQIAPQGLFSLLFLARPVVQVSVLDVLGSR